MPRAEDIGITSGTAPPKKAPGRARFVRIEDGVEVDPREVRRHRDREGREGSRGPGPTPPTDQTRR